MIYRIMRCKWVCQGGLYMDHKDKKLLERQCYNGIGLPPLGFRKSGG